MDLMVIIKIVVVEVLHNKLYKLFTGELINLNIGYAFNRHTLFKMNEIINAIDYIENGNSTSTEIIKIIQYYEEI